MKRPSPAHQLRKLYAQIPHIDCKGLCYQYCGPIGFSKLERQIIVKACGQAPRPSTDPAKKLGCVLLDDQGRCKAYQHRPVLCRLWGVTEGMTCPYGCAPEDGRYLTDTEAKAIIAASMAIGGVDSNWAKDLARALSSQPDSAQLSPPEGWATIADLSK